MWHIFVYLNNYDSILSFYFVSFHYPTFFAQNWRSFLSFDNLQIIYIYIKPYFVFVLSEISVCFFNIFEK